MNGVRSWVACAGKITTLAGDSGGRHGRCDTVSLLGRADPIGRRYVVDQTAMSIRP